MSGFYLTSVLFFSLLCNILATENEQTFSKFMYDKQMLETIVRLEAKMSQWDRERKTFEENVLSLLEHRREEMEQKFKKQKEKLEDIYGDFENIREDIKNKSSELQRKIVPTPRIAFNAYTTSSANYGNGQIVTFPNVLLNEGAGYDKNTGVFTAPVAGLYHFSVHICHVKGNYMVAAIVHGAARIAVTSEYEHSGESCSSAMAPLIMRMGERVHVQSAYSNSRMRADNEYRWPSFSGVLLNKPDYRLHRTCDCNAIELQSRKKHDNCCKVANGGERFLLNHRQVARQNQSPSAFFTCSNISKRHRNAVETASKINVQLFGAYVGDIFCPKGTNIPPNGWQTIGDSSEISRRIEEHSFEHAQRHGRCSIDQRESVPHYRRFSLLPM